MRRLIVAGAKGGIGKTTTAISFAAELSRSGYRVALFDLDPQASATLALGQEPVPEPEYAAPVPMEFGDGVSFHLYPGGRTLEAVVQRRLEDPLRRVGGEEFDIRVVDCPPALGARTVAALGAADLVVTPIQPTPLDVPAARDIRDMLSERGRSTVVHRILLVRTQPVRILTGDIRAMVAREFPGGVYTAEIPEDVRAAEAPAFGLPVTIYAPRCRAARAYRKLTDAVLSDLGLS
jgi:chromosome partitioning protein